MARRARPLDAAWGGDVPNIPIGTGQTVTSVVLYLQSSAAAIRGSSSSGDNMILTVTKGAITPVRIVNQGGLAALECRIDVAYDGTNLPVQRSAAE